MIWLNKTWKGKWITGSEGTKKVLRLSESLNQQSLDLVNRNYKSDARQYRPWMSSPNLFDGRITEINDYIVNQEDDLKVLSAAFCGDSLPLDRLKWDGTNLFVMTKQQITQSRFEDRINAATELMSSSSESLTQRMKSLVFQIVPLFDDSQAGQNYCRGSGISSHLYRGGVHVAPPTAPLTREITLATNIAHELGHQALIVYQYADPLLISDPNQPVYSAVRKTLRPALMSYHGMIALMYMVEFLFGIKRSVRNIVAEDEKLLLKTLKANTDSLSLGLQSLRLANMTELGSAIATEAVELLSEAS